MGTRLSTTRFIKNGRISAVYESVNRVSVNTAFITMSKDFDEIDNEVAPQDNKIDIYTTNVFAKGANETLNNTQNNAYGYSLAVDTGVNVEKPRLYTIDWNRDRIVWEFEGQHKRTYNKGQPALKGTPEFPENPKLWYPTSPSRVQFALWDTAGKNWTGGKALDWRSDKIIKARFYYYQVQCYNDENEPVNQWPLDQSEIEFAKPPQSKNDNNREEPNTNGALANSVFTLLVLLFSIIN